MIFQIDFWNGTSAGTKLSPPLIIPSKSIKFRLRRFLELEIKYWSPKMNFAIPNPEFHEVETQKTKIVENENCQNYKKFSLFKINLFILWKYSLNPFFWRIYHIHRHVIDESIAKYDKNNKNMNFAVSWFSWFFDLGFQLLLNFLTGLRQS